MKSSKANKKGKVQSFELSPAEALFFRDRLKAGEKIKSAELLRVVGANRPCSESIYDKNCKGKRDNPNCFCGLIPAPGSVRKKGLWQKDPEALKSLGSDPAEDKREVSFHVFI